MSLTPIISHQLFIDILHNPKVTKSRELQIFRFIYSMDKHEATATDIAKQLEHQDKVAVIGIITRFAKRIIKNYDVVIPTGGERKIGLYELFFTGYWKGKFYVWQLRKELIQALEELSLVDIESHDSLQNTFLFSWNPNHWDWDDIDDNIEELNTEGTLTIAWSCQSHKKIKVGDRAFIVRLGTEPKGIMASGYITSHSYLGTNIKEEEAYCVDIEFEYILNPRNAPLLSLETLRSKMPNQHWTPQASGTAIDPQYRSELEFLWFNTISSKSIPSGIPKDFTKLFTEGKPTDVVQTRYEKSVLARKLCLDLHGYSCAVCEFNFYDTYGDIGTDFIHVHHKNPQASIKKEYQINPYEDLVPVCPNCHAMLHKKTPPYTIEELKNIIELNNKIE